MDDYGNPLSLTCEPGSDPHCSNFQSLLVNDVPEILFGERYPGNDGHPRRTIPVQYCRKRSDGDSFVNDFAYCVLSEAPALQPVPIVMHCEVEQFLTEGTPVVVVGFGRETSFDMPPPTAPSATSTHPSNRTHPSSETSLSRNGWAPALMPA